MIIPSIDILGGKAVQLRGGRQPPLDAGDPRALAERYARAGEIAIVDLDAALGRGSNKDLVLELVKKHPARVGGGIRSIELALEYLNAGARKIMIGTAATPEFLARLPRERLIVALDSKDEVLMVEGWTRPAEGTIVSRMKELAPYVSGFLVTFIETEGDLCGIDLERARSLVEAAGTCRVTFAGGATGGARGLQDIAALDAMGADLQVGTALVTGSLDLAEAFAAPLRSDRPDGLWPTLVCDESGKALGLTYSNIESLRTAFSTGVGAYHSRRRGLWIKGDHSGDRQYLIRAELDCDRDTIRFIVRQEGRGFCHLGRRTCFDDGYGLEKLFRTVSARMRDAPQGSYTRRLFTDAGLLASKIREEADELARAATPSETVYEAADLMYFALVKACSEGVTLADIEAELERRSFKVTRRGGDAKPGFDGEDRETWKSIH